MTLHSRSTSKPKGELEISCEHFESGSSHIEKYVTSTLSAFKNQILLTIEDDSHNAIRGKSGGHKEKYTIEPAKLVALIKKHGDKLVKRS